MEKKGSWLGWDLFNSAMTAYNINMAFNFVCLIYWWSPLLSMKTQSLDILRVQK